jgi:hypothetical protein
MHKADTMDDEQDAFARDVFIKAVAAGPLGGLLLVVLLSGLAGLMSPSGRWPKPEYGFTLLLILPLTQSVLAGLVLGSKATWSSQAATVAAIVALDYGLAMVFLREGAICLIIGLPLYLSIVVGGLFLGYALCILLALFRGGKALKASVLPLIVVAVVYDAKLPPPVFTNVISDAVTIDASLAQVWRYIVDYPENGKPPEYWLWQIGLPAPVQSTAHGAFVGAKRQCRFTDGIVFEEEITEVVPDKVLTFKITAQPDHPEIIGHFSLDKGQLYLEANADGTTTVIATSWYRIFVRPAGYFDWWAGDIVRNVHFRVLNHMKELAETDKRTAMMQLR